MSHRPITALATLAVLLLLALATGRPAAAAQAVTDYVPDEVLVSLKPGGDAAGMARGVGARAERQTSIGVWVLKVPAGTVDRVVDALSRNPNVEFAEPNGIAVAFGDPNDPYDNGTCYNSSKHGCVTQWAWTKIQAYQAWDVTTGSGVRVAVVDTGIDNSHPDLPTIIAQRDVVNNDAGAEDDNGHGTHVAGTIGALTNNGAGVAGMNWNVGLIAVKVLNAGGSGSYAGVAEGIKWAADNGAQVINLSLGGSLASRTLKKAVDYAWNKGAVLACAAGNNGTGSKSYPAAYDNCIAVAATDANDAKASFSNYGSRWVDVAAPGVAILSTMPNSAVSLNQSGYTLNYDSLSGTSMSTPHVAGLAGLVWATGKCGSPLCVRSRIESNADKIGGTGQYWSKGRINAFKAVSAP